MERVSLCVVDFKLVCLGLKRRGFRSKGSKGGDQPRTVVSMTSIGQNSGEHKSKQRHLCPELVVNELRLVEPRSCQNLSTKEENALLDSRPITPHFFDWDASATFSGCSSGEPCIPSMFPSTSFDTSHSSTQGSCALDLSW